MLPGTGQLEGEPQQQKQHAFVVWRSISFVDGCRAYEDLQNTYKIDISRREFFEKVTHLSCSSPSCSLLGELNEKKHHKRIKIECTAERGNFVLVVTELFP